MYGLLRNVILFGLIGHNVHVYFLCKMLKAYRTLHIEHYCYFLYDVAFVKTYIAPTQFFPH